MTRMLVNGVNLNVEVSGKSDGPAILMLHGFTGDHSTWDQVISEPPLTDFRTIRVDIIGHGASDSPLDPLRYSMGHAVEDLTSVLDQLEVDRYALLGYSMGGRLALHLALAHKEKLWALMLESASEAPSKNVSAISRRSSSTSCSNLSRASEETKS